MGKIIENRDTRFSIVGNTMLQDPDLSLKAKGLAALIFSLGDGWEISIERLMVYSRDGKDATKAAVQELEKAGYLAREQTRDPKGLLGDMDYRISDYPMAINPLTEYPTTDNPPTNKITINKETSYKETRNDISTPLRSVDNHMAPSENPVGIQSAAVEGPKAKKSPAKITRKEVERVLIEEGLDASEELVEAIWGWKESRDRLKKPLTDRGLSLAIRRAKKIYLEDSSHPISEIFDVSTQNGWVGIFPVRTEYANGLTDRDYAKARLWGKGLDHQAGYTFKAEHGEL